MGQDAILEFVANVLIILAAGLAAGVVCRRMGASLMVGYMLAGTLIGKGGLALLAYESHALEGVATIGVLLLLFSVGNEFSLEEFVRHSATISVAGAVQMTLSAAPVAIITLLLGLHWQAALLLGFAASLSSTVLVFRGLTELGQIETLPGRRAVGILLFQDMALVPLVLLTPLLSGEGEPPSFRSFANLAAKSVAFIISFLVMRQLLRRWAIQLIAELRSLELICLFAVTLLGGACVTADFLDLPPAIGAFAAGTAFSGTRLSVQIDSILLPFRETFAAVFFVTLGAILRPGVFLEEPALMTLSLFGILAIKGAAATIALRLVGLSWQSAAGMGLGLTQLGEFAFLLLLEGQRGGVIDEPIYNRMLFVALGTLIITPMLLRIGLRYVRTEERHRRPQGVELPASEAGDDRVLIVGAGPIGRDVAAYLETSGWRVALIDLSPVNLHPFAQQGFDTAVGDAREAATLEHAGIAHMRLAIVCLPNDEITAQVTAAVRAANPRCAVIARVRYLLNIAAARKAGAAHVVSEESEAASAILASVRRVVDSA